MNRIEDLLATEKNEEENEKKLGEMYLVLKKPDLDVEKLDNWLKGFTE